MCVLWAAEEIFSVIVGLNEWEQLVSTSHQSGSLLEIWKRSWYTFVSCFQMWPRPRWHFCSYHQLLVLIREREAELSQLTGTGSAGCFGNRCCKCGFGEGGGLGIKPASAERGQRAGRRRRAKSTIHKHSSSQSSFYLTTRTVTWNSLSKTLTLNTKKAAASMNYGFGECGPRTQEQLCLRDAQSAPTHLVKWAKWQAEPLPQRARLPHWSFSIFPTIWVVYTGSKQHRLYTAEQMVKYFWVFKSL